MRIPVLLEPVAGNGYRARGAEPFPLTAEGPTPDQALARLKEMIQANLTLGAQIVSIEVLSPNVRLLRTQPSSIPTTPLCKNGKIFSPKIAGRPRRILTFYEAA